MPPVLSSKSGSCTVSLSENTAVPEKKRPRVLVIANQKGGVGKTTTAINLGTALAAVGQTTLVIDLDPQGNASTGLGIPRTERKISSYDVLMGGVPLAEAIIPTRIPGLHIVPATQDLSGAELELVSEARRNFRLREALAEFAEQDSPFSYVLIDCPPALGLLTVNAMAAADAAVVPLQCEFFALEGLSQLLKTIERVRANLNPALEIQGVILTMFDKRNNLSDEVARDVRAYLGDKVYQTIIPRNVRISEAPSHGLPALVYDLRCPGSQAYIKLAGEMIQRERARLSGPLAA
ncbi:MAG TPA: ParA family protein [Micropepsaceae bacterium]|nr:ParA family protein [Micropepsaceae bacterium]